MAEKGNTIGYYLAMIEIYCNMIGSLDRISLACTPSHRVDLENI